MPAAYSATLACDMADDADNLFDGDMPAASASFAPSAPSAPASRSFGGGYGGGGGAGGPGGGASALRKESSKSKKKDTRGDSKAAAAAVDPALTTLLDALVPLQSADGSFALDAPLARLVGKDLAALRAAVASTGASVPALAALAASSAARAATVFATALALALLRVRLSALEDEWSLFEARSRAFASSELGGAAAVDAVVAAIQSAGLV